MRRVAIDASGMHYRILNERIRGFVERGEERISVDNVCGQRYIGAALSGAGLSIDIRGTAGNDLAAFMDGPCLEVKGNVQDGAGNTMNSGTVVIHGNTGDILGHAMRGGEIFVKGDVGYRVGIHMKEYKSMRPVLVIGGVAGRFLGEYMAGGSIIVLGMGSSGNMAGDFIGTGMHGGAIYIRGGAPAVSLGREVKVFEADSEDMNFIKFYVERFSGYFGEDAGEIMKERFSKLIPVSHRPYGNLYAY